jgi:hypothetical protein
LKHLLRSLSKLVCLAICAGLAKTAAASSPAPPTAEEQAAIIEATRNAALTFSDTLPDFICTQVTRRWVGQSQSPSTMMIPGGRRGSSSRIMTRGDEESWTLLDTLTIQLSYFGQKEQYKLLLVNGAQTKRSYESLGGTLFYGDFGSVLGMLFQQSSKATFEWDHWGVLNGQLVMVFKFAVAQADSQWRLSYESKEVITAFKGLVFIDPAKHQVLKLKARADEIPKNFPVEKSALELDYRVQSVGDRDFLLPLKAVNWSEAKNISSRNEAEFRLYRKFTADSKLSFETPAPLTEGQVNETIPK